MLLDRKYILLEGGIKLKRKLILTKTVVVILSLVILPLFGSVGVNAASLNIGYNIQVQNTLTLGLNVRSSPAGPQIGTNRFDGALGVIIGGPQYAPLGATTFKWWQIKWKDDGLIGWSAEGYPGGLDYLVEVVPDSPITTNPGSSFEPGPVINTLTPTLHWAGSFGADYYALAISEYPYGTINIIYNPQQLYGTSHTVPVGKLECGKKYRWNMQAHSGTKWSVVSNLLYFQTPPCNQPPGNPPIAEAGGPYVGFLYEQINFDASASYDPDGGNIIGYRWDWENDGIYDTSWLPSPFLGYTFGENEEKHGTLKLEVKDNNGATSTDTASIDISSISSIDYIYTVDGNFATITGYTGAGGAIMIPSMLGGYSVTTIGDSAFSWCNSLTAVTIPDSVTTIGYRAFFYCSYLKSVTIPDSITTIENGAFYSCSSLTSVTIPNSVTTIEDYAFYDCLSLTSVTIGSSVTNIRSSLTNMGVTPFHGCSSLIAINVDAANINYASIEGVLYNKAITTLIRYPEGKAGTFIIPDSVITIDSDAFFGCSSLTSVTIPNSVITIGTSAFYGCSSLTFVTIPDSVTDIGYRVFNDCDSLISVTFGSSVTTIPYATFESCKSLTSVTIGSSVTSIEMWAFQLCSYLTSITFLGLVAPTTGYDWIRGTPTEIRGHAYAASNFPPPGSVWNGLTMGSVIEGNQPPTLEPLITQLISVVVPISVEDVSYRIATLSDYIDPTTLEIIPNSDPCKVYLQNSINLPVTNRDTAEKIGRIDFAFQHTNEISQKIEDINTLQTMSNTLDEIELGYALLNEGSSLIQDLITVYKIHDAILNIQSITDAMNLKNPPDALLTDGVVFVIKKACGDPMQEIINYANTELSQAKVLYLNAQNILNNNQNDISDYSIATDFLSNYLYGQAHEQVARLLYDKIFKNYQNVIRQVAPAVISWIPVIGTWVGFVDLAYEAMKVTDWTWDAVSLENQAMGEAQFGMTFMRYEATQYTYALANNLPNHNPILYDSYIDPLIGNTMDHYNYYVTYFDEDGDDPVIKQIYIDDEPFDLLLYSTSNGAITYRYSPTSCLSEGGHNYYFYFKNVQGDSVRLPSSSFSIFVGPIVEKANIPPQEFSQIQSPGELHVSDSNGLITGVLNGQIYEEIPNSSYDPNLEAIFIYPSDMSYKYSITGTDEGTYGLLLHLINNEGTINFTAIDIPIIPDAMNQYLIDWAVLTQGQEGITIQIDNDGDGVFERTITSNSDLTHDEYILKIDDTPPTTSKNVGSPKFGLNDKWVTSSANFNLTATDDLSGVNKTYYQIWYNGLWKPWTEYTQNFTLSDEGKHYLEYYSIDKAGNIEETHNQTHNVDDTSPSTICSLSGTLGQNAWYKSNIIMTLIATDTQSGVNTTSYRINGGSWQKYTATLTLSSNGIHLVDYYSTDKLGNKENTKSVTIKIDKTTPSLIIIKPEKGFLYINDMKIYYVGSTIAIGGITVKVNTSDTESGIAKVEFYVDNKLKYTDITAPYEWKWNEKIYCKHKLKTITYNQAGQTKTAEMDVWIFKW